MTWLDWFGFAADLVTFVGIPVLWFGTRKLRSDAKERKIEAGHRQIVSQGCVDFYDTREKVGVNLVPFEKLAALPRPGDFVVLPGDGGPASFGEYEVEKVSFSFQEAAEIMDQQCPAIPSKIIVSVHKRERK